MAKIFRLCLLLLLFPSPGARASESLRAVVAGLECPATKIAVRDGRELAAALERTLRQSPGGGDLCVTWIDRAAPPFAGGGWSAELVALPARRLLAEVCANAGVFWGFRHGGIALSARGLRGTEYHWTGGSMLFHCEKPVYPSPFYEPRSSDSAFATFLPSETWRPGQVPSLMDIEQFERWSLQVAEDNLPSVREAMIPVIAGLEFKRVLISATWIGVPPPTPLHPEAPLDGPEVRRLLRAGKARVLNHQAVATLSGINAVLETVDEVIYPTQFDGTDEEYGWMTGPGPFMVPTAFETREVGVILNVTPTVSSDRMTISLQLLPESCQLASWQPLGQHPPPGKPHHQAVLRMPTFRSVNLTTGLLTRDDGELVQKMGRDPATGDWILLHIHVRLLNADGTPRNPS